MLFDPTQDTPARPNARYVDMWRDWSLMDDIDGGIERMRFRGRRWLPAEHLEEPAQYDARLLRTDLFPGVQSALDDAVARPFAKPVQVENLPDDWHRWLKDLDGSGADLTQFLARFMRAAVKHGLAHILVDFTDMGGGPVSRAVEIERAPRPWWRIIEAPQLLGFKRVTLPDGTPALSEVRIHEIRTEPDGAWGEVKREYVRVLRRDSFELYVNDAYQPPRDTGDNAHARFYDITDNRPQSWKLAGSGRFGPPGGFASVPLVTAYTGFVEFMVGRPPFLALAEQNLAHLRSQSDQNNLAHFARVPILFARGFAPDEIKAPVIGAGAIIRTTNVEADLRYVEHGGQALELGHADLDRQERRMEQLGVRPHIERMQGATATGIATNASAAETDVQSWAQAVDTAAEKAFELSAHWLGQPYPQKLAVQIFKDYAVRMGAAQDLAALQDDVTAGRVTHETYLREARRRGLYGDDLDIDAEIKAGQAKEIELEAARREALMQQPAGGKPAGANTGDDTGGMPG